MSTIKVDTYLTRGGASEIAIDKLKGVTAAGSMLVVGEGGSTTTNLQQGLAKAFLAYKATDTAAIYDSNNISSVGDNGTGDTSPNYTNNFNSGTGYACSAFAQQDSGGGGRVMAGSGTPGTGDRRVESKNLSNASCDLLYFNISFHGDLS